MMVLVRISLGDWSAVAEIEEWDIEGDTFGVRYLPDQEDAVLPNMREQIPIRGKCELEVL